MFVGVAPLLYDLLTSRFAFTRQLFTQGAGYFRLYAKDFRGKRMQTWCIFLTHICAMDPKGPEYSARIRAMDPKELRVNNTLI